MPITVTCQVCGKQFKLKPSHVRRRKTCSHSCQMKLRAINSRIKQTRNCDVCGKPFSYYLSDRRNPRYCSRKCFAIGYSRTMNAFYAGKRKYENSGIYVSNASFRQSIKHHLPSKCEVCGWDEGSVDVCHVIPRNKGGKDNLANVIMLCPNHHRLLDQNKLSKETALKIIADRSL